MRHPSASRARPPSPLTCAAAGIGLALLTRPRAASGDEPGARPREPRSVEVKAAPTPRARGSRDPSVAAGTLDREELTRAGLGAGEALRTEVGTSVTESGGLGAPATASIRGATAAQTPVYLGGVRINDDVAGTADLSSLPLWLVNRVEVYRGNAPFGADRLDLGGAIFFEPLRPRDTRVAAGTSAGSYGTRGTWVYGTAGDERRAVLAGASFSAADNDYATLDTRGTATAADDRTRRLTNADASLADFWLIGRSALGSGRVELLVNHFERKQGAPLLGGLATFAARERLERSVAAVAGHVPLGSEGALELRTTALLASATLSDPRGELLPLQGSSGTEREQRGERVEEEIGVRGALDSATRARVLITGSAERLRRYERGEVLGVAPRLDAERTNARAAAMLERDLGAHVSLRALLAADCYATSTATLATACDRVEPTGRLGALARAGELTGFAGVGRYARQPTLGELYGTSLVVHGNPALLPETGVTFDLGGRAEHPLPRQSRPAYAAVAAYYRRAGDLITYVATPYYVTPVNRDRVDVTGLELEGGVGFLRYLAASASLTLADFRDRTPGSKLQNDLLPFHARLVFAPALKATSPRLGWLESRASLEARLLYQSSRYADFAGTDVIPEQTSLDLDAVLAALDGKLVLRGRVSDVLDAQRFDVVGFPLPGRSVFVSLEARGGPF